MNAQESGLTNAEYAIWMTNTASQDCTEVSELHILYMNDTQETLTDNNDICQFMQEVDQNQAATFKELKFSGTNESPWYAIDKRVSINLERTVNFAGVPIKIKRPTGG